jgi:hypothetical protein
MRCTRARSTHRPFLAVMATLAALLAACTGDGPSGPAVSDLSAVSPPLENRAAQTCTNVSGTIVGNVLPPPGAMFPVPSTVAGDLQGMVTAYAEPQDEQRGNGSVHLATFHLFILPDGLIQTEDAGVMAPRNPPYYRLNNRYTVVGGDGLWAGASGFLQIQGTLVIDYENWLNPENGDLDATYRGRLCRPAGFTGA